MVTSLQNYFAPHDFIYSEISYSNYNNFVIFRRSFYHLLEGQNLYARFADEHADYFKYSPAFSLFMGLFALLPVSLGLIVWNLGGGLLVFYGLQKLIAKPSHRFLALVLLLPELVTCMSNCQSNSHIAGLLLLSFDALEKHRHAKASIYLMLTVFIKLFSLAFLPLFFLYPKKERALLWLGVSAFVLFFVPVIVTGLPGLMQQYANWLELLKSDHSISSGLGVAGLAESWSGNEINKNAVLYVGATLLLLPLVKTRSYMTFSFRSSYLCFLLLWVVLFNHKAESPTYIIAMTGAVYFAWTERFRGPALYLLCAAMLCTSLATTDLVPYEIRKIIVAPYRLKALVPSILLIYTWIKMMTQRKHREENSALGAQ